MLRSFRSHLPRRVPLCRPGSVLLILLGVCVGPVAAQQAGGRNDDAPALAAVRCLPDGAGYLRARISGTVRAELSWGNKTQCTGAVRPTDGGIRMRFRSEDPRQDKLVLVFGIARLREGQAARNLPVNVTLIREGTGEFYSTQGDDKCMLDRIAQEPIVGIPHRSRSYRVTARGFCTKPARAVRGAGAVLLSRFDFVGRVDFDTQDRHDEDPTVADR